MVGIQPEAGRELFINKYLFVLLYSQYITWRTNLRIIMIKWRQKLIQNWIIFGNPHILLLIVLIQRINYQ